MQELIDERHANLLFLEATWEERTIKQKKTLQ